MSKWRELSMSTKIFYIAGLISFICLAIMILTGMTSIGGILARKWDLLERCPWCM